MPRPLSFKTSLVMRVLGMSNTGVTGILRATRSSVRGCPDHPSQDILCDGGLGHVKHGSDWDLLGKAGLDKVPPARATPVQRAYHALQALSKPGSLEGLPLWRACRDAADLWNCISHNCAAAALSCCDELTMLSRCNSAPGSGWACSARH